jgi:hypothetical protein
MADEHKTMIPEPIPATGKGVASADPPAVRSSPGTKTESADEFATEFAAVTAPLEELKGPVPADMDEIIWRWRVMSNVLPRLRWLVKMVDVRPAALEPLQSAFLLNRYDAMYVAAGRAGWRSVTCIKPKLTDFDLMCEEPDIKAHLVKYGCQPGVVATLIAYAEWRAPIAELGASALAFLAESRAEFVRKYGEQSSSRG